MNTYVKRSLFLIVIIILIYINYKLNNIFKNGYISLIKYFFIGLGLLFMMFPNFDKDYRVIKKNLNVV